MVCTKYDTNEEIRFEGIYKIGSAHASFASGFSFGAIGRLVFRPLSILFSVNDV